MACIIQAGQVPTIWLLPLSSYFLYLGQDQVNKMENLNKKAEINTMNYLKSNVWEYLGFTKSINDNNVRRGSNDQLTLVVLTSYETWCTTATLGISGVIAR